MMTLADETFDPRVPNLLLESLGQVWTVEVFDRAGVKIPLDVKTCEITMDEDWTPYVQGRLTAVVPTDQATLDRLDPRLHVKVIVHAGYVLPGDVTNLVKLAEVYVSGRSVNRPNDEIELSLQGPEYLLSRAVSINFPDASAASLTIADAIGTRSTLEAREAIAWILNEIGSTLFGFDIEGAGWDYDGASRATGWSGDLRDVEDPPGTFTFVDERYGASTPLPGTTLLDVAMDIAALNGVRLYCDEDGVFHAGSGQGDRVSALWYPPGGYNAPVHALTVGSDGTIVTSDTTFDRDTEWANLAAVHFSWDDDETGHGRWGFARVTGGPFDVAQIGVVAKTFSEDKPHYVSQEFADKRAETILRRQLSKGRTIVMESLSAYWLRPAHWVTIQLPLGPLERHIVSAVTFRFPDGVMSVTTHLPDTASQITLGGA